MKLLIVSGMIQEPAASRVAVSLSIFGGSTCCRRLFIRMGRGSILSFGRRTGDLLHDLYLKAVYNSAQTFKASV